MVKIGDVRDVITIGQFHTTEDKMNPSDERAVDGYGQVFCPTDHARYVLDGITNNLLAIEEDKRNAPPFVQPEWKEKPAGHYEKGSGF